MKYKSDRSKSDPDLQERLSDKLEGVVWHGHYYTAVCPFHVSFPVRASLFVYDEDFRCASCNEWGYLNKLEAKLSGMKVRYKDDAEEQEVNELPKFAEWKKQYKTYKRAAAHAYQIGSEYPMLMKYLKQRGLHSVIDDGLIGYMEGWLSFPVFNVDGIFVDWVLRATPAIQTTSKYVVRPRKNREEGFSLYSADWGRVIDSNAIYIPFGVLDMHVLCSILKLPAATGLTGKTYKTEWFSEIRKPIYLIPDKGEEIDAYKIKQSLGWRGRVLLLDYKEDEKDCADVNLSRGSEVLHRLISDAKEKLNER